MPRQHIVAGNWKMNMLPTEGQALAGAILESANAGGPLHILCPPFIHLPAIIELAQGHEQVAVGAQNCHQEASGAYTGEVAAPMLAALGAAYVILGHSERRAYFGEDDELLARKIDIALANDLRPIFCCGETLDVRKANGQDALVAQQVATALFHLDAEAFGRIVIAYEPVWAIGTGETATPEQAQAMHRHIRRSIRDQYGDDTADATSILYGGSVKPDNAAELFGQADVDGGLIGGASLKADAFLAIADSF